MNKRDMAFIRDTLEQRVYGMMGDRLSIEAYLSRGLDRHGNYAARLKTLQENISRGDRLIKKFDKKIEDMK